MSNKANIKFNMSNKVNLKFNMLNKLFLHLKELCNNNQSSKPPKSFNNQFNSKPPKSFNNQFKLLQLFKILLSFKAKLK